MKVRCIRVDIFKDRTGDCSNRGISSRFSSVLLPCEVGPLSFDGEEETPLNFCMICSRFLFGEIYLDVVPAMINERGQIVPRPGWWMFGGTIAHSSDSRFSDMAGRYPLKIRDRRE